MVGIPHGPMAPGYTYITHPRVGQQRSFFQSRESHIADGSWSWWQTTLENDIWVNDTKCSWFRNPAPVEVGSFISLFTGFYTSQVVVWDFFHQQYIVLHQIFQPSHLSLSSGLFSTLGLGKPILGPLSCRGFQTKCTSSTQLKILEVPFFF